MNFILMPISQQQQVCPLNSLESMPKEIFCWVLELINTAEKIKLARTSKRIYNCTLSFYPAPFIITAILKRCKHEREASLRNTAKNVITGQNKHDVCIENLKKRNLTKTNLHHYYDGTTFCSGGKRVDFALKPYLKNSGIVAFDTTKNYHPLLSASLGEIKTLLSLVCFDSECEKKGLEIFNEVEARENILYVTATIAEHIYKVCSFTDSAFVLKESSQLRGIELKTKYHGEIEIEKGTSFNKKRIQAEIYAIFRERHKETILNSMHSDFQDYIQFHSRNVIFTTDK